MNGRLVTAEELAALEREGTNAHRFWTGKNSWVDRFGDDFLFSAGGSEDRPDWLPEAARDLGLPVRRIFVRRLVKQPGEDDLPVQVAGEGAPMEAVVSERRLRFGIDFAAGYSVGLFCDQRANRAHLEKLSPRRLLNCFAYTCAFSAAAARVGAETLSLDLAGRALERGRANIALNGLDAGGHRFIADDVFEVLPRLARRGEKFDAIILDPPTFSRGARGRVFRVERDFEKLLVLARDVASAGAHVLLSTNAKSVGVRDLRKIARDLETYSIPPPPEYPPGSAALTLWAVAA